MSRSVKAQTGSSNGDAPSQSSYTRLSVVISRKASEDLAAIRERDNLTATDGVNRAISTLRYLQKRMDQGARLLLEDENGTYEVVFQ